jgi:DNA-binding CsgD family transcriptional regulator
MRVAPWDAPDEGVSVETEAGGPRLNAMRSWLVSGVHMFVVDPRRRFGRHGHTRELLVVERPVQHEGSERWQTLAAALHRHTVRDGLAQLSAAERRIITLAYLEGHTNREIAAMLGVSVSTVRRRLLGALEHLDTFLRRSGAWLAALALAALAYLNGQAARGARWAASPVAGDKAHLVAATLAIGHQARGARHALTYGRQPDRARQSGRPCAARRAADRGGGGAAEPGDPRRGHRHEDTFERRELAGRRSAGRRMPGQPDQRSSAGAGRFAVASPDRAAGHPPRPGRL